MWPEFIFNKVVFCSVQYLDRSTGSKMGLFKFKEKYGEELRGPNI